MAHLKYFLYDRVNDLNALIKNGTSDALPSHYGPGTFIHNLNIFGAADKAAAIKVTKDRDYRRGDHIRLLDQVGVSKTDAVSIDPDIRSTKVDLHKVIFNNRGFDDRAAGVEFVRNPNSDGSFRLRVRLYDKIPAKSDLAYPTLVLYDWEFPSGADLNYFHFADRTAYIKIEKGPKYVKGDTVTLQDSQSSKSSKLVLDPEKNNGLYDLHTYNFADKAARVEFTVVPNYSHLVVGFFNRVEEDMPMFILSDINPNDPKKLINSYDLNLAGVADKTAKVTVNSGLEYIRGDHIRLLDEVNRPQTDTVSIDPDIRSEVDLHKVIFNNKGFDDRAAGIEFVRNPNKSGGFRLRVRLYDMVPNSSDDWAHPSLILYDWEFPNFQETDLNNFHFADRTAAIWVEKGPDYIEGDRIIVSDHRGSSSDIRTYYEGKHYLNREGWADKIATVTFDLVPLNMDKNPEKVELFEGPTLKLILNRSDLGSLNNRIGYGNRIYNGKATAATIYGAAGSAVTFFDNQGWRLDQNAVRIRKLVDEPVKVNIATNFVNANEEAGDNIYYGKSEDGKYEWTLFKRVKKNWIQENIPFDLDELFKAIRNATGKIKTNWSQYVDAGVSVIQATGIGKKGVSSNYRVDNCSSVYFDFEKV